MSKSRSKGKLENLVKSYEIALMNKKPSKRACTHFKSNLYTFFQDNPKAAQQFTERFSRDDMKKILLLINNTTCPADAVIDDEIVLLQTIIGLYKEFYEDVFVDSSSEFEDDGDDIFYDSNTEFSGTDSGSESDSFANLPKLQSTPQLRPKSPKRK